MTTLVNVMTVLNIAASGSIVLSLIRNRGVPAGGPLVISSLAAAFWSFLILAAAGFPSLGGLAWLSIAAFGCMTACLSMYFMAAVSIAHFPLRNSRPVTLLLLLASLATVLFYIPEPIRHFFYSDVRASSAFLVSGRWIGVMALLIIALLTAGAISLVRYFQIENARNSVRLRGFAACYLALYAAFLWLTLSNPNELAVNRMLPLISAANISVFLFLRNQPPSLPLFDRKSIVENMVDGWMVLDASNRIVDLNKTAEDILGSDRNQAIGKSIETYHIALPHLMSSSYAPREIEMKRTIKTINEVKFFNIRLSPIWSDQREPLTLVIWRDITNRRLLEEQRQKARDEMFVLLNAISSEASQSFSMEEFLSGVIYQIIFPFKSQAALIFLAEEYQNTAEDLTYRPASAFGLPEDSLSPITPPSAAYHLLEQVFSGEALVLEKPVDDLRLPSALRNEAFHTVLALPLILITGGNVKKMGVIFLARKNPEPFHQDEIVRLKTLADHIANLADSERRRKLAIAFSERQRLMRDLHDSVSQKLYGLVTLTEAAQAAVEAGSQMDPVQVFSRIGENARQAVKEMRLFLYQMQPVEVEKEGLISVLHHRLAAVEGRADIKAGLLADETIKLPSDKELALFYIAQEALNNILRHAHAKKVTVTYKQTRTNIILRIMDDGVGFNIKEVDHSGLGMANMKDRAEKINGKFKIISKVGRGTIVSVSLPKTRGK